MTDHPHSSHPSQHAGKDPAVEMIRQKIENLYSDEPEIKPAMVAAVQQVPPGSKHKQFMTALQASGASTAETQAAWHSYYVDLPDHEKHEVWQEFYAQNSNAPTAQPAAAHTATHKAVHHRISHRHRALSRVKASKHYEKAGAIKKRIVETVKTAAATDGAGNKLTHKHHLQSIFFGLGCGLVVLLVFLFSFFNEVIIAPFIQPSRQANNTPIIVDTASTVITGGTKVIIPKINLEIPVDYSQTTTSESAIELALDNGVVHYPSTNKPGQTGNAAYFGHSSNNIFNPGKYKFAFVLLHELTDGDIFYLNYNDKTYAYRVFSKQIVSPKQVDVLNPIPGKSATATLITCDPPGTSINRLVVVGEQISPDPNTNGQPDVQTAAATVTTPFSTTGSDLPGNGPSLWSRIIQRIF